ncbi:MAG: hypothetical protein WBA50_10755 [Mycobacterium sp.]
MTPKMTAGIRLRKAMDEALARAGQDIGQHLEWTADEMIILERAASAADRAEELRDRYRDELADAGKASSLTRLSAEIRQLDRLVVDLVGRVNPGVGPAKSQRHQRAARARWQRREA